MPEDVYKVMKFLEKADREMLYALHLDAKIESWQWSLYLWAVLPITLSIPERVFKGAILNNSASVALVHNHPSGDAEPSRDDLEITERIIKTGELIGIPVIDHMVIGNGKYVSIKTRLDHKSESKEMKK